MAFRARACAARSPLNSDRRPDKVDFSPGLSRTACVIPTVRLVSAEEQFPLTKQERALQQKYRWDQQQRAEKSRWVARHGRWEQTVQNQQVQRAPQDDQLWVRTPGQGGREVVLR